MKSATMRYWGSGLISHKNCNHEISWIWCYISQNLQPWDIAVLVKFLFQAQSWKKRVPTEHQGIHLQNFRFNDFEPLPPLVYFLSGSSATSTAPDVLPSPLMMTPGFTSLTTMASTTWPFLPSERSLRDIRMSGDKKLKEANVADFHCNISQILDLWDIENQADREVFEGHHDICYLL